MQRYKSGLCLHRCICSSHDRACLSIFLRRLRLFLGHLLNFKIWKIGNSVDDPGKSFFVRIETPRINPRCFRKTRSSSRCQFSENVNEPEFVNHICRLLYIRRCNAASSLYTVRLYSMCSGEWGGG